MTRRTRWLLFAALWCCSVGIASIEGGWSLTSLHYWAGALMAFAIVVLLH